MIKNVIFDLGNVLISFRPEEYFHNNGYEEEVKKAILNDVINSREWMLLDNGDITIMEAIEMISETSSLKKEEIASVFNLRTKIMYPIIRNAKLLPALKKRGLSLYFLSNFASDIFDEVQRGYRFFKFFDGGIISSRVKISKPDKRIFEILMDKYSLVADDCLFIDDVELNARAAISVGMKSIWVSDSLDLSEQIEREINKGSSLTL
jgi:FMN phosphatase YigB (HAD superfamily)